MMMSVLVDLRETHFQNPSTFFTTNDKMIKKPCLVSLPKNMSAVAKRQRSSLRDFVKRGLRRQRVSSDTADTESERSEEASVQVEELSCNIALGAGNFYGTEKICGEFEKQHPGAIIKTTVGFMSPYTSSVVKNPTYEQVCSGTSGHVQVVFVELSNPEKHLELLLRWYFMMHDPTTKYKQGDDRGFQYASWIFCGNDPQYEIVKRIRLELQDLIAADMIDAYSEENVCTNVSLMHEFTPAPECHQQYLTKNPDAPCYHRKLFEEWPVLPDNILYDSIMTLEQIECLQRSRDRPQRIRGIIRTCVLNYI
jgi:peptide-methionine (S)-S-oxide reductase